MTEMLHRDCTPQGQHSNYTYYILTVQKLQFPSQGEAETMAVWKIRATQAGPQNCCLCGGNILMLQFPYTTGNRIGGDMGNDGHQQAVGHNCTTA